MIKCHLGPPPRVWMSTYLTVMIMMVKFTIVISSNVEQWLEAILSEESGNFFQNSARNCIIVYVQPTLYGLVKLVGTIVMVTHHIT